MRKIVITISLCLLLGAVLYIIIQRTRVLWLGAPEAGPGWAGAVGAEKGPVEGAGPGWGF